MLRELAVERGVVGGPARWGDGETAEAAGGRAAAGVDVERDAGGLTLLAVARDGDSLACGRWNEGGNGVARAAEADAVEAALVAMNARDQTGDAIPVDARIHVEVPAAKMRGGNDEAGVIVNASVVERCRPHGAGVIAPLGKHDDVIISSELGLMLLDPLANLIERGLGRQRWQHHATALMSIPRAPTAPAEEANGAIHHAAAKF